ncbi:MAG: tetratricopeptide repeat protein [Holosporaceae bacterium]|jgi:Flp pilus assembly protein TadD|nr:tetratricopeptide repeat protein [Holosporaceae bacterium]
MKKVLSLLLIGILLNGCAGKEDSPAAMIRIAQKARKSGHLEAALNFYNKALKTDPDNCNALLGLAEVYIDMKLLDAATEYIRKSESRQKSLEKASYLRGKICLLAGDDAGAEREFLKGKSADSLNALGAVYDSRGEHKKAQELYKQVISHNPNYIDAYNNIGLSLMLCDKYSEAIFYLENACSLQDANVAYRSNLALAYGLSGNVDKARSVYAQDFEGKELEEKIAYLEDTIAAKHH